MKKKIVLAVVTTMVSQTVLPVVYATTSAPIAVVAKSSPALSAESTKFLDTLSKLVTTKSFRSDVTGAILGLSNSLNNGDYRAAYDSLPAHEKKILADRYGITSAGSFAEHVGKDSLAYKFTPADLIKGKFSKFSKATLATISKRPVAKDLVLDGSGNLLWAYVNVSLPGIVLSDSISWKSDSGKMGATIAVFVSKDGKPMSSYFGPVRVLSTGKWIEVVDWFTTNANKTTLDIGKTRWTNSSDQAKIFQELRWQSQYDARITVSDSNGNEVLHFSIPQNPKVRNGFVRITVNTPLLSNNDYTLSVFTPDSPDTPVKTVDFRY